MRFRTLLAAALLVLTGLVAAPAVGSAAPAAPAAAAASCTKTSSGTCINKGGQYCPKKSYGKSGYDKNHKRWVCKGDRNHPRWTKP